MLNIFLIHGAWSSTTCFNYLIDKIQDKNINIIKYDYDTINSDMNQMLEGAIEKISELKGKTIVLGHSLGGVLSLGLEDQPNVSKIITVASPIAGIKFIKFAELFLSMKSPFISDISTKSKYLNKIHNHKFTKPVVVLVANKGYNPSYLEKNDGVVTVSSQSKWIPSTGRINFIEESHHCILQSSNFVNIVREELDGMDRCKVR